MSIFGRSGYGSLGATPQHIPNETDKYTPGSSSSGMESPLITPAFEPQAWCSVSHPQPAYGCTPTPGIAKPVTAQALSRFKGLQSALNRLGASIKVDGYIGSGTLNAYNTHSGKPRIGSVDGLAQLTLGSSIVATLQAMPAKPRAPGPVVADGGGLPPPTVVNAGPVEALLSGDVVGFIKHPVGIALTLGVGFIAYKILSKPRSAAAAPVAVTSAPVLVTNPWGGRRRRRRRRRGG